MPMPGCRNNSGRPRPRSTSSTLTPSTTTIEVSATTFIHLKLIGRMVRDVIICERNAFHCGAPPGANSPRPTGEATIRS
jgi:hypothetical protein